MKEGRASQTSELVCMGRAIAHGTTFSDPTAYSLLPASAQAQVDRVRSGAKPESVRDGFKLTYLRTMAAMMAARTVEIDSAVREAACPQLVILGAGLDGRAWRMTELEGTTVFEVDHPDTQRDKKLRAAPLVVRAREVRFVPVDFARDSLDEALEKAGHDASRPTMWIWEGVVMYLTREQVEASLRVIERRSAEESFISIAYHRPALILRLVGFFVGRLGEPLRSTYTVEEMRALLAAHHFSVLRDRHLGAARVKHMRVVTAKR